MTTIDERLMALLIQHTGSPREAITADAGLDALGLESLSRFELAIDIEDEFGFSIDDDQVVMDLETVQDLLDLVKRLEAA